MRGLKLTAPYAGLDFACLPRLEVFHGNWHKNNCGLKNCHDLDRLTAWGYKPASGDLTELGGLTGLRELKLIQTSITSLAGVKTLEDLHTLDIAYAPKLLSIDALADEGVAIRELRIEKAKRVVDLKPITRVKFLRRLHLFSCAPMKDLRWMRGMDRLGFFAFVETNVEDGDLSPLFKLPSLRYVGTMDKRHYSHKCDVVNEILAKRIRESQVSGGKDSDE